MVWVYHNKSRENDLGLRVGLPVGGPLWETPRPILQLVRASGINASR